jgi:hypothetical protein
LISKDFHLLSAPPRDMKRDMEKPDVVEKCDQRAPVLKRDRPHIPLPVKFRLVKDRAAFKAELLRWADIADLKRILVSHGSTIETNPRGVLRRLADSLG